MLDTFCGLVLCAYVKSCKMTSEMILCVLSGNLDKQSRSVLESVKIRMDLLYETDSVRANIVCLKS